MTIFQFTQKVPVYIIDHAEKWQKRAKIRKKIVNSTLYPKYRLCVIEYLAGFDAPTRICIIYASTVGLDGLSAGYINLQGTPANSLFAMFP